jgi:hypothetical protein
MKEHTFNRSIETPVLVTEPNFDDERTLRSARPVVPLAKIDAKLRYRRHWLLGGAFALAMMLGAASALLASYLNLRNVPNSVASVSEVESTAAPVVAAAPEAVASELPANEDTEKVENPEESVTLVVPRKAPTERRRLIINRNSDSERPRVVRETDDDDEENLERIREAVLLDAWEERRARRAARRERRNRADHHDRDLSNLDEIFEGRRRRRP